MHYGTAWVENIASWNLDHASGVAQLPITQLQDDTAWAGIMDGQYVYQANGVATSEMRGFNVFMCTTP